MFRDKPDVIEKIIFTAGGAFIGFLGGFGYGKSKKND